MLIGAPLHDSDECRQRQSVRDHGDTVDDPCPAAEVGKQPLHLVLPRPEYQDSEGEHEGQRGGGWAVWPEKED